MVVAVVVAAVVTSAPNMLLLSYTLLLMERLEKLISKPSGTEAVFILSVGKQGLMMVGVLLIQETVRCCSWLEQQQPGEIIFR